MSKIATFHNLLRSQIFIWLKLFMEGGLSLENKKKEVSDSVVIEETLFFYPLSGMLNALISAIYNKNNPGKK